MHQVLCSVGVTHRKLIQTTLQLCTHVHARTHIICSTTRTQRCWKRPRSATARECAGCTWRATPRDAPTCTRHVTWPLSFTVARATPTSPRDAWRAVRANGRFVSAVIHFATWVMMYSSVYSKDTATCTCSSAYRTWPPVMWHVRFAVVTSLRSDTARCVKVCMSVGERELLQGSTIIRCLVRSWLSVTRELKHVVITSNYVINYPHCDVICESCRLSTVAWVKSTFLRMQW